MTVLGGGTFRSGAEIINDVTFSTIENLVKEISASPSSRVIMERHTDNRPTGNLSRDNMELSLLGAKVIANILIAHEASLDRILEIGYGDAHPIGCNDTEEGQSKKPQGSNNAYA